jgi:hypothetical protein
LADEWEWSLATLVNSRNARRNLNAQLRLHVENYHTLDAECLLWPDAYARIVDSTKNRRQI